MLESSSRFDAAGENLKSHNDLTQGSELRAIIGMTLPMMVGMVGMVAFNLVDTYFVGQLGTDALAAMSFTLPVVFMQSAISMGLGVGASAVIARAIGEKNPQRVKRLTTDALILSLVIVFCFVLIGLLTIDPLFSMLGADAGSIILIRRYMQIWYPGLVFVVIPMVGNNAIRAAGNTSIPSMVMLVAIFINLVLDPILIFGWGPFPRLELEGAAIATVIARSVTLIVSLLFLHFKFSMLTRKFSGLKNTLASWREILHIGVPAALTQVLIPLAMGLLTRMISAQGNAAVAAFGVCSRIEMFVISPITALAAIMTPYTGQNFGAAKIDRIQKGFKLSTFISLGSGVIAWLFFLPLGDQAGKLFNRSAEVYLIVGQYLRVVAFSYGFHGISMIVASIFNALRKPMSALAVNFCKLMVMLVPFCYVGLRIKQLSGAFIGISAAYFLSGFMAWLFLWYFLRKMKQE